MDSDMETHVLRILCSDVNLMDTTARSPETELDKMKELEKTRNSMAHSQESQDKRTKKWYNVHSLSI